MNSQFVFSDEKVLLMQPYQPGYTVPSPPPQFDDTTISIRQVHNLHRPFNSVNIATMGFFFSFWFFRIKIWKDARMYIYDSALCIIQSSAQYGADLVCFVALLE
ncbi:hypothetical protein RchiOBHm_Chr5g0079951 [Rosa chinensis]|uniref:Uncharacterized protein n=1 Tax=Rosa chinensis TaxID=74649 RepID=A0A2P6QMN4_ROSCH|nr:hypothetical protein RchiOBHm_Chr5g0079951 [Rosa chinensis]